MEKGLSAVAGIIDPKGGLRVVVTPRADMRHHVGEGERLFVVPGFFIEEPVAWNYIPTLIRRVELYIEWWLATRNDPNIVSDVAIKNYLKNPNAAHNFHPGWFHYAAFKQILESVK